MRNNKAVTLVALIITVIILLILAGVVIAMTIGDEGIINKSQTAVEKYQNSAEKEQELFGKVENYIDEFGKAEIVLNETNDTNYLFHQGKQYEEITGGWARTGYDTALGTVTIKDNYIYLWGQANKCRPFVGIGKKIDFSKYSTMIIRYSGGGDYYLTDNPSCGVGAGPTVVAVEGCIPNDDDGELVVKLDGLGENYLHFTHCYGGRCYKFVWTIYLFS